MNDPLRVLILDDDFRVGRLHRSIIDDQPGFSALEPVRTLAEARDGIRSSRPDLLLADVFLPDGDGIALVRELSDRTRARVMANGELMATEIGARFLKSQGVDVTWMDARDMLARFDAAIT